MTHFDARPRSITIVRHGETDWNAARLIQGRTEIPLNETGRAQAQEAAELLLNHGPWAGIVASPLARAAETARIIAAYLELTAPTIDGEILERDFGPAESISVPHAEERWPGLDIPGAETLSALATRASEAFARIMRESPGCIVVAHGALIRAGLSALTGSPMPRVLNGEAWRLEAFDNEGEGSSRTPHDFRVRRLGAPVVALPK